MRILFTGASSFTGFWFVKTLVAAGHDLVCPVTAPLDRYDGVRRRRVEQLRPMCRFVADAPFGSDAFVALSRERFDLLCHHAAEMTNYRSPDFDAHRALGSNTLNLRSVLREFRNHELKALVLTGSVFESDEGIGDEPLRAFSPYGLSKALTYQVFRHYCGEAGVPLGKFVIPNPFGPFEEPRFTAYLMRNWSEGKTATVNTPDYIRDNIHADLLASAYRKFVEQVADSCAPLTKLNPSGYVESQGDFAGRVGSEVRERTGWKCDVELARQTDFNEPIKRVNSDAAASLIRDWSEQAAWDGFVKFYTVSSAT